MGARSLWKVASVVCILEAAHNKPWLQVMRWSSRVRAPSSETAHLRARSSSLGSVDSFLLTISGKVQKYLMREQLRAELGLAEEKHA